MTSPPHLALTRSLALGLLLAGGLLPPARGDDPPPAARPAQPIQKPPAGVTPLAPMPSAPMSLIPAAPAPIPDDPPPHEGAMVDYPLIIEPPDIITVEVVEALPGRPITGERLVRPDGTISLGFYGDVHVRGLTPGQAKAKVIFHLRGFLSDHVLGLVGYLAEPPGGEFNELKQPPQLQSPPDIPPVAEPPGPGVKIDRAVPQALRAPRRTDPSHARTSRTLQISQGGQATPAPAAPAQAKASIEIETDPFMARPRDPLNPGEVEIEPLRSNRVFVDLLSYNAKVYYVQGDVGSPGRLPFTGKETVLDALIYAHGLIPTAEPTDVHLYRPARGGKPAKDYAIDLQAVWHGDAKANLQIFPNDRLVVGRNPVVKKTIEIDRAAAPINSMLNSLLQYAFISRTLALAAGDVNGTTQATRDEVIRKWFDLLWNLPGGKADNLDRAKLFEVLPLKVEPKADDKPASDPR